VDDVVHVVVRKGGGKDVSQVIVLPLTIEAKLVGT